MSEPAEENGNGNRATVAMVLREVENLAKVTGAHFETVNVKLDANAEATAALATRLTEDERELRALSLGHVTLRDAFDRHVKDTQSRIEAQAEDKRFHRIHWPTLLAALFAIAVAIAAIVFN